MFLSLDLARSLINLLTLVITYFWLIPLLGCFRAWVAKKMGDNTPEMLGFLTLDPFVHVDMVGLAVLCLFGAGWGVHIPIYLSNIQGRYANFKRCLVLFSDTFLSFIIAIITVIVIVLLGYNYAQILEVGSQPPSAVIAFKYLLHTTLKLSLFLMLINLIINFVSFVVWIISRRTSFYNMYIQMFLILGPLLICMLFGDAIIQLLFQGVQYISVLILRLLGVL
jgi:hypothetical protein